MVPWRPLQMIMCEVFVFSHVNPVACPRLSHSAAWLHSVTQYQGQRECHGDWDILLG